MFHNSSLWTVDGRQIALLNDDQVLTKMKRVLLRHKLDTKIDSLTEKVVSLNVQLAIKDAKIDDLTTRVESLLVEADRQEQYSRRPNLRFQGVPQETTGAARIKKS